MRVDPSGAANSGLSGGVLNPHFGENWSKTRKTSGHGGDLLLSKNGVELVF